jgi:predicted extracellular nuclease/2',3'-cyclic-nucleotide 2'-phosphodiesterase (5'-nucleotidase family)
LSSSSFPAHRGGRRRHAGVAAALVGLVSTTLALGFSAPAQAATSHLVISEAYGGGGNSGATYKNDYIELYNPTSSPIDVSGWSVQYRNAAGTVAIQVTPLSGSVPAGGYYLVQEAAGAGGTTPLPAPDATGEIAMGATGFQVWIASTDEAVTPAPTGDVVDASGNLPANIVDLLGASGTAGAYEKTRAAAPSNTLALKRTDPTSDSNTNGSDFATGAPAPQNCNCAVPAAPKLVISEVFSHGATGGPHGADFVEVHNLGSSAADLTQVTLDVAGAPSVPLTGSLGAGGRQVVDVELVDDNGSTSLVWENDSSTIDLVGWGSGAHEGDAAAPAGSATESAQRDEDDTDTDQNGADFRAATPSRGSAYVPPPAPLSTIAEVQGTGDASPKTGDRVRVQGVVTAAYPSGSGNLGGFYIQTGGKDGVDYNTPGASDAIFVFMGTKTSPAIGTSVEVTGPVSEFFGTTEISPAAAGDVKVLGTALPPVVPGNTLPGTDCALPGTDCLTGAALEAAREEHEGEAFLPTGDYTVTDAYDGTPFTQEIPRAFHMQGEFGLAANSTQPLMIPTELHDQSDSAAIAARRAWNDAHAVVLDDGADIDYVSNTFEDTAFPWLTPDHTVRVGASVSFVKPVILEYRRDLWRIQPQSKIAPGSTGSSQVTFEQDRPAQPEDVGGDLKIATFNMLNYFNTTGESWAASDGAGGDRTCDYHSDRNNARITNDTCEQDAVDPITGLDILLPGPRGAANQVNFERQEAKELEAINTMDADVMSLEEVENSVKLYDPAIDGPDHPDANRDDALIRLVEQLNLHWANAHPSYVGDRWAYVPSPRREALPTVQEQDAIRSAFIYNPSKVETVGRSRILTNSAPFRNAREPLAQAFKPLGSGHANAFGVVVNHFKSKGGPQAPATVNGDNEDSGDGAGFYNGDRKRQAAALVSFSDQFAADKNIEAMFLTGDYNAYAMEDPIQVITEAGYHDLHPADGATTYNFGGLAGSLDHVFANPAADAMVTGVDVWEINANETVYNEYSRFNANLTNLYAVNAFRSSDHNPEIIGINSGGVVPDTDVDTVRVLATNDFHGRILDDPGSAAAGAASLAGAVKTLRAEDEDLVFAAAGDLIGASTFESFVAHDKPTIDALNEAGLEVSAAGNHEFDRGYRDLVDRVMKPASETNPEGGAGWQYIAGNVRFKNTENGHTAGETALPETWYRELPNGRTVGFVGAVTEDLPALVAGDGISEIEVTDIVDSVNSNADELKAPGGCGDAEGCDLVVMLVHEGAADTSYSAVTDDSTFAQIVSGADPDIDAIVSGHTHLAYNHKVPVQEWIAEGRTVTKRPVVSAGQYGANLNSLEFEYLPGTDQLVDIRQTVLALKDYDTDAATQAIVDDAVDAAAEVGNRPLGDIAGPFQRARRNDPVAGGVVENRGGESTLGNLVAEIQRWKTDADIGFMNPGGLRADMLGALEGDSRVLTYRQAADVQPFANTLVTMDLTGAQIRTILEQQWQRDADGNIPSRPFLRLGTSKGFTSTYDASRDEGDRITGMWLDGEPIALDGVYRVAATSFLASGTGDNFWGFDKATNEQDTGKTDLQAVVDYMAANAAHGVDTLPVDYRQHAVGVDFPAAAPSTYVAGDRLAFDVSSLAMTGADDQQDSQVELLLGDTVLGTFPVTNALTDLPYDEAGTASIAVDVPAGVEDGTTEFTLRGVTTGTTVTVPVATDDGRGDTTTEATAADMVYGTDGQVEVKVTGTPPVTGGVELRDGDDVVSSGTLADNGTATLEVPGTALPAGQHGLTVRYLGDGANEPSQTGVAIEVARAASSTTSEVTQQVVVRHDLTTVQASVTADGFVPTGQVEVIVDGTKVRTLALESGSAFVELDAFPTVGQRSVVVKYLGDANTLPSQAAPAAVDVVKARPTMTLVIDPDSPTTRDRVQLDVSLAAPSQVVTGEVRVWWKPGPEAERKQRTLSGQAASFELGRFIQPGDHEVRVRYYGSSLAEAVEKTLVVRVVKK